MPPHQLISSVKALKKLAASASNNHSLSSPITREVTTHCLSRFSSASIWLAFHRPITAMAAGSYSSSWKTLEIIVKVCDKQAVVPDSIFVRILRAHWRNVSSTFSPVKALVSRNISSVTLTASSHKLCTLKHTYVYANIFTKHNSKVKYAPICIALYHDSCLKRSGWHVLTRIHSFTCHPHVYPQVEWTKPAFTPQPQSITTLWPVLISHLAEGRRLSWHGWLGEILRWFVRPKMVTHPSTNRARRRVTSLIRPTTLSLRHAATKYNT